MTLLFMDGFDSQAVTSKGWSNAGITIVPTAQTRFNYGSAIAVGGGDSAFIKRSITPSAKVIVGFAAKIPFWSSSFGGTQHSLSLWGDGGLTQHLTLARPVQSDTLVLRRGGTPIATGTIPFPPNGWAYVEMSATIADSGGRVIVKINGAVAIDFTGDTKNAGTSTMIDSISLHGALNTSGTQYDDVYICNGLGTKNNDFLGDQRVVTRAPNAPGSASGFTSSSGGPNWDNVNEIPASIADYNASSVPGTRDLYEFENLPNNITQVAGVQLVTMSVKTDAGDAFVKNVLSSGGSTVVGPPVAVATDLSSATTQYENNPSTSAAWTVAAVNALQGGAEVG